jgi:hypothetical protein
MMRFTYEKAKSKNNVVAFICNKTLYLKESQGYYLILSGAANYKGQMPWPNLLLTGTFKSAEKVFYEGDSVTITF